MRIIQDGKSPAQFDPMLIFLTETGLYSSISGEKYTICTKTHKKACRTTDIHAVSKEAYICCIWGFAMNCDAYTNIKNTTIF